jgi:hypothetical protein
MTSEGSAYARFRRGLVSGNVTLVMASAAELPQLSLYDALAVCLILLDDPRAGRAIARWHARWVADASPAASVEEAQLVLSALNALRFSVEAAADTLLAVFESRDQRECVRALEAWCRGRVGSDN